MVKMLEQNSLLSEVCARRKESFFFLLRNHAVKVSLHYFSPALVLLGRQGSWDFLIVSQDVLLCLQDYLDV
jgi:hypothetical protein